MEGWRSTMLLIVVLTGDMLPAEAYELRWLWVVLLLTLRLRRLERVDEAEDERRNEVRMACGCRRAVRDWKREEDCILTLGVGAGWELGCFVWMLVGLEVVSTWRAAGRRQKRTG